MTSGPPLAGGLALTVAEPNTLVAFNAAPGTFAPTEQGPYGAYARVLTEMIRDGGLPPSDLFEAVRLRVNEETKGAQVPWDASRIAAPFLFFERAANAPPPALAADRITAIRSRPLRDLGAQDAYAAVIERDTMQGYEDFLTAYPTDPLAYRVRAILAARREATTWLRTCRVGTPDAYWSYLNRYPNGPHAADARWRLDALAAAPQPPPSFVPMIYDVPPPPPRKSSTSIARCLSSMIRCSVLCRRRRSSCWRRRRLISSSRRRRPWGSLCCRLQPSCRCRLESTHPPMSRRRPRTLFSPIFTTRPSSTRPTSPIRRRRRGQMLRASRQGLQRARRPGRDRRESRPAALRGPQGVPLMGGPPHGRARALPGSIPAGRGRAAGHELPGVSPGKPLPPEGQKKPRAPAGQLGAVPTFQPIAKGPSIA